MGVTLEAPRFAGRFSHKHRYFATSARVANSAVTPPHNLHKHNQSQCGWQKGAQFSQASQLRALGLALHLHLEGTSGLGASHTRGPRVASLQLVSSTWRGRRAPQLPQRSPLRAKSPTG